MCPNKQNWGEFVPISTVLQPVFKLLKLNERILSNIKHVKVEKSFYKGEYKTSREYCITVMVVCKALLILVQMLRKSLRLAANLLINTI